MPKNYLTISHYFTSLFLVISLQDFLGFQVHLLSPHYSVQSVRICKGFTSLLCHYFSGIYTVFTPFRTLAFVSITHRILTAFTRIVPVSYLSISQHFLSMPLVALLVAFGLLQSCCSDVGIILIILNNPYLCMTQEKPSQ